MKWDLGNWKPSCEQAKFIAQSARLIGIGLMALVGTRLATGYIDGKDTMAQEIGYLNSMMDLPIKGQRATHVKN